MKASKLQAAVEAILFASGEPIELERIAEALEIEPELCEQVLYNLSAQLDERNSGITVLKLGDKYQLSSRTAKKVATISERDSASENKELSFVF